MQMDALMSRILTSARMRASTEDTHKATPLDLSWNSFTTHTCHRFINHEDIRTEPEIDCSTVDDELSETKWGISHSTPDCPTVSVPIVPVKQEKQQYDEPHPFSIAALVGESSASDNSSEQAHVFSPWMGNVAHYPIYYRKQQKDNIEELSPIRAVSMLKAKDVYWCHVCNVLCTDKNEANRHQLIHRVHRSNCNLRRHIFNEQGYVTRHEQMDNDRLHCSLCNKVISLCFFTKHQRLHDGHFCRVCNMEFSTNSRLQDHMNVHTGMTPFECKICDRKFSKRSSLAQHQRYHRDHKSFMCKFCRKCFNSKYACAVHERLHTGENPFKCLFPGCNRAFPQKIQLKLHINSNHRV